MRVVIIGAGGQARENAWYVKEVNRIEPLFNMLGFVVSDLAKVGPRDSAQQILGGYEWLREHPDEVDGLILGVGTPTARLRIARDLTEEFPHLQWPVLMHPGAMIDGASAKIGRGALLAAGVVATVNIEIGDHAMLNFGCTVGHESRVGNGTVINPGARISGGVTLGEGSLVGSGAVVLQYLRVGDGATVGAGAVVTRDVPDGTTVVGVPARPLRRPLV